MVQKWCAEFHRYYLVVYSAVCSITYAVLLPKCWPRAVGMVEYSFCSVEGIWKTVMKLALKAFGF